MHSGKNITIHINLLDATAESKAWTHDLLISTRKTYQLSYNSLGRCVKTTRSQYLSTRISLEYPNQHICDTSEIMFMHFYISLFLKNALGNSQIIWYGVLAHDTFDGLLTLCSCWTTSCWSFSPLIWNHSSKVSAELNISGSKKFRRAQSSWRLFYKKTVSWVSKKSSNWRTIASSKN